MNRTVLFIGLIALLVSGGLIFIYQNNKDKVIDTESAKSAKDTVVAEDTLRIVTSFYPLAFITKELTGDLAEVKNLSAGQDPHDYQLTVQDRVAIEKADLVIIQGADFEPWGDNIIHDLKKKESAYVVATAKLDLHEYKKHEHHDDEDEEHDKEEDKHGHEHGLYDPHTWLDPILMRQKVNTISEALISLDPEHETIYTENATTLIKRLDELHNEYTTALQSCSVEEAIVSHNVFGYLSDRYGIKTHNIAGLSTTDTPSASLLAELAKEAQEGVTTILTEDSSVTVFAETLARETGLDIQPINTIEFLIPEGEDYFSLMRSNLASLVIAYGCEN